MPIEHRKNVKFDYVRLCLIAYDCLRLCSIELIKINRTQSNAIEHNQINWIIKKCENSIDVQLPNAIIYRSILFTSINSIAIKVRLRSIDRPWIFDYI